VELPLRPLEHQRQKNRSPSHSGSSEFAPRPPTRGRPPGCRCGVPDQRSMRKMKPNQSSPSCRSRARRWCREPHLLALQPTLLADLARIPVTTSSDGSSLPPGRCTCRGVRRRPGGCDESAAPAGHRARGYSRGWQGLRVRHGCQRAKWRVLKYSSCPASAAGQRMGRRASAAPAAPAASAKTAGCTAGRECAQAMKAALPTWARR
jgi:hypothetical protein